ncbi:MAG: hypothetical protein ABSF03_11385 [Streptosporangiaceae bacterium]
MSIAGPTDRGFAERIPLVLLLDTSASMARPEDAPRISELNTALGEWITHATADPVLREQLEVAIVTFDSEVRVLALADGPDAFALVGTVTPPKLEASGFTLMLPALETAVRLATERTRELTVRGIPSRRPLVWLVTDGAPSDATGTPVPADEVRAAARLLHNLARPTADSAGCLCYVAGVCGADLAMLNILAPGACMPVSDFGYLQILGVVSETASRHQAVSADDEYARTRQLQEERARRLRFLDDDPE